MSYKSLLLSLFILFVYSFAHSQRYTISGYVQDRESAEPLVGVTIVDLQNQKYYTRTNEYGYYSITLPAGQHLLYFFYPGYISHKQEINLTRDIKLNIVLTTTIEIQGVDVVAEKEVQSAQMSQININVKKISKLPMLMGESDVLKIVQLMPGVQSGIEGTSGFMVRGGTPDQNLILLDGVPVYNVNHLFGFFSVFTPEAIKNVKVIKGGFPARYGGRLSSVLDIRMKEGNMEHFHATGSVGLVSSKVFLEGPIKKNVSSFIFTARRTYIDLLSKPIINYLNKNAENEITGGYYFYDLNAKVNTKIGDKDRLYLSVYGGKDKAFIKFNKERTAYLFYTRWTLDWGNMISSLRWNHRFNKKLFANTTLIYSKFDFNTGINMQLEDNRSSQQKSATWILSYNSGIYDLGLKLDIDYLPVPEHKIRFGGEFIFHTFEPGISAVEMSGLEINLDTIYGTSEIIAQEAFVYIEDEIIATNWLKFNLGTHLSGFSVRDTVFLSPEPRLSASIILMPKWSIKLSYSKMQQYIHLLTTTNIGLPMDLWLPATDLVVPQKSTQYALGSAWQIKKLSFSFEGFYKEMDNLIEMREGESIFGDRTTGKIAGEIWEQKILQGQGWAYGLEFFAKKESGKFTGWLAYSLSWTLRQFDSLNFGRVFPYRYDRRHDFKIVSMYRLNKNWSLSATWVYNTGIAITVPLEQYISVRHTIVPATLYSSNYLARNTIQYFQYRNNYRLPSYHRMDISATYTKNKNNRKKELTFGIYNLYNRQNPFYVQFDYYTDPPILYQYSIFQIMPFVSYKIVF